MRVSRTRAPEQGLGRQSQRSHIAKRSKKKQSGSEALPDGLSLHSPVLCESSMESPGPSSLMKTFSFRSKPAAPPGYTHALPVLCISRNYRFAPLRLALLWLRLRTLGDSIPQTPSLGTSPQTPSSLRACFKKDFNQKEFPCRTTSSSAVRARTTSKTST